jgi:predicted PurR-regulated permease PerM
MAKKSAAGAPRARPSGVSLKRQLIFWSAALLVFVLLLWLLNDVLLPFVVAMGFAYLLDPLVQRMQRLGIGRPIAALIIVVGAIVILGIALVLLVPILGEQISGFIARLPAYLERVQKVLTDSSDTWIGRLVGERLPEAQKSLSGLASQAAGWIAGFLSSLWSGGKALVSVVSLVIITPVVTFYLLLDWDRTIAPPSLN